MGTENGSKRALVLGGGGFIGGHLARRLKQEGYWVRIADIKPTHEYWDLDEICDDYISCDLTDPERVKAVMRLEAFTVNDKTVYMKGQQHKQPYTEIVPFDKSKRCCRSRKDKCWKIILFIIRMYVPRTQSVRS